MYIQYPHTTRDVLYVLYISAFMSICLFILSRGTVTGLVSCPGAREIYMMYRHRVCELVRDGFETGLDWTTLR